MHWRTVSLALTLPLALLLAARGGEPAPPKAKAPADAPAAKKEQAQEDQPPAPAKKAAPKDTEPEPPPPLAVPFHGEITDERVYIRAGDGINYTVLAVAGRGDRVRVKTQRFGWLGIAVPPSCTLWVHKSLLQLAPDGKTARTTGDRVNTRARAQREADIVGQLPEGATVQVVDRDGDWVGIRPPEQATAWVHRRFVRKTTAPPPEPPPKDGLSRAQALAILRDAQQVYAGELRRPPKERDFTTVLAAYQKVAEKCADPELARRAERARQRLLKIVDLHQALQAAREPIERFEKRYEQLEAEYKKKAAGKAPERPE